MELKSYDYRDPGELVDHLARHHDLTEPAAYLAIVEDPSTTQRIVSLERLDSPALLDDWEPARDELRARLEDSAIPTAGPPPREGPRHSATVVVVRPGFALLGPNERGWHLAWRYVNTLAWTFTGGLIVVTEHGWYDPDTRWGAPEPALRLTG